MTLLLRWLQALPEAWVRSQLQLQLLQAGLFFLGGKFEELYQRLAAIERDWKLTEPTELQGLFSHREIAGLIAALQAEIALFQGDPSRALPLFQQALEQLDRDILGLRSVLSHNLALNYYQPQNGAAHDTPPLDHLGTLMELGHQAGLKRRHGQYRQSIVLLRRIVHMAAELIAPGQLPIMGLAHGELSHLLYEANELDAAEAHARQGIELGRQGAGISALFPSYIGLILVKTAQHQFTEASGPIDQMEQLARRLDSKPFIILAALQRMNICLEQGDLQAAARWQQAAGLSVDGQFDSIALLYRGLARVLIARGELDAAATLLTRLIAFFEATDWIEGLIRTLPIQAVAFSAQQQLEPAMATLQRALTLAQPEAYIRSFVDLGLPMAALLRQAAAHGLAPRYVGTLLAAFAETEGDAARAEPEEPNRSAISSQSAALVEPLTPRELEVLRLIATGHSNREIARLLVVSLGTVKKHLSNIFGKLATTSRTQAIARARELQLL
jgi:LuxR family maltose regulon positive regulatory protein